MRVAIAGGHGQIALLLAQRLGETGDEAVALIRNPDHEADVRATGAEPVVCDLERAEPEEVAGAIGGADAVVFAAGAGPGSGPERKETMDYGGALKLLRAAQLANVERYVIVSSMGADPDAEDDGGMGTYQRAKGRADAALAGSDREWTIVRPGLLTNDAGTGRVALGESVGRAEVPRADVAAVLAAVLRTPSTAGRTVEVVGGDVSVDDAVAQL